MSSNLSPAYAARVVAVHMGVLIQPGLDNLLESHSTLATQLHSVSVQRQPLMPRRTRHAQEDGRRRRTTKSCKPAIASTMASTSKYAPQRSTM